MNHPEKQCHQTTPKQTCCDEPCSHKVSACLPRGLRQRRVLRCTLAVQLARLPRRPEVLRGERHIDVLADTVPVGKGVCQANGVGGEGGRWPGRKGPHQGSAPPPGTKRLVQTRKGGVGSVRKNPASQRGTCRFCFFDCASVKQGDTPPAPPPPHTRAVPWEQPVGPLRQRHLLQELRSILGQGAAEAEPLEIGQHLAGPGGGGGEVGRRVSCIPHDWASRLTAWQGSI